MHKGFLRSLLVTVFKGFCLLNGRARQTPFIIPSVFLPFSALRAFCANSLCEARFRAALHTQLASARDTARDFPKTRRERRAAARTPRLEARCHSAAIQKQLPTKTQMRESSRAKPNAHFMLRARRARARPLFKKILRGRFGPSPPRRLSGRPKPAPQGAFAQRSEKFYI